MSFLDNLENNLKALEGREENDPEKQARDKARRDAEREAAVKRAPYVEALRNSKFTSDLLTECRTLGRAQRTLVQFAWVGAASDTLRLEAKDKRMELVPGVNGVEAVFFVNGNEAGRTKVDLMGAPSVLAMQWLA